MTEHECKYPESWRLFARVSGGHGWLEVGGRWYLLANSDTLNQVRFSFCPFCGENMMKGSDNE